VGLKLDWTHEPLAYADDVSVLVDKRNYKEKKTLIYTSNEVALEDVEKTKYMLLSHHQIAGKNQDIKITNISF
jgi:hypothetical protein